MQGKNLGYKPNFSEDKLENKEYLRDQLKLLENLTYLVKQRINEIDNSVFYKYSWVCKTPQGSVLFGYTFLGICLMGLLYLLVDFFSDFSNLYISTPSNPPIEITPEKPPELSRFRRFLGRIHDFISYILGVSVIIASTVLWRSVSNSAYSRPEGAAHQKESETATQTARTDNPNVVIQTPGTFVDSATQTILEFSEQNSIDTPFLPTRNLIKNSSEHRMLENTRNTHGLLEEGSSTVVQDNFPALVFGKDSTRWSVILDNYKQLSERNYLSPKQKKEKEQLLEIAETKQAAVNEKYCQTVQNIHAQKDSEIKSALELAEMELMQIDLEILSKITEEFPTELNVPSISNNDRAAITCTGNLESNSSDSMSMD